MQTVGEKKKRAYYQLSPDEVLADLATTKDGLSAKEALARLTEHGPNALQVKRRQPWVVTYLGQFKDLMILLLLVSSGLAWYLGDQRTAVVLLGLVLFNTSIGFLQEFKAEKTLESLEKLVVAKAHVYRDGTIIEIDSSTLVIGDAVRVETGDNAPADLRVITEDELSTNDFALSGESNPTRKFKHALSANLPLSGRQNIVFMGTTVATGEALGVVIATGMQTEIGRIASLSASAPEQLSPLQREINNIATKVTWGTIVVCSLLLPVAIMANLGIKEAFLFAIGIASSLIPQGLPAEINTSLASAANKLAHARALVKKLSAVETLGATNVILTDKTGTLTRNQMTVEEVLIGKTPYRVTGSGYETNGAVYHEDGSPLSAQALQDLHLFFETGVLASNATVHGPDESHGEWYVIGDPTEGALITLAHKAGIDSVSLTERIRETKEYAFDSARKRMSSVRVIGDKQYLFVKGAPESVLSCSVELWDHGHVRKLSDKDRQFFLSHNEQHAAQAERNLAYAYRVLPKGYNAQREHLEAAEQQLVFLGMVNMLDPLRDEVTKAMIAARKAHMRVSIITGDFATTARAIAARAKLAERPEDLLLVSGEELPGLSDEQVLRYVRGGGTIFSRVAPEDKLRIVEIAERDGLVVAVTGDGINDAPALKRANIGVAMGVTGTDVAKQSADIILLDDSFHTLVGAVQEGRAIFHNIQKGTLSCFTSNIAELVINLASLGAALLFHVPLAMSVMLILAVDLIAELFPIAALGNDKAEGKLMAEPPRDLSVHILNRTNMLDILRAGLLMGGLAFANYLWYYWRRGIGAAHIDPTSLIHMGAMSMTYLSVVLMQLMNILQRRSEKGLFTRYQLHNRTLWGAMALSLTCVIAIVYSPLNTFFSAAPLGFVDWLWALAAVAVFVFIRETHLRTRQHARIHTRKTLMRHSPEAIRGVL